MIRPSSLYGQMTASPGREPIFYCQFGQVGDGTTITALPDEFCTAPITNPTKTRKAWMLTPSGGGQSVSELGGTSSISSLSFAIQDRDGEMTKMIFSYHWKNRIVTVYSGYVGLPESQFLPMYRGILDTPQQSADGGAWIFQVTDFQRWVKSNVVTATSQIMVKIDEKVMSMQIQPPQFTPSVSAPWFAGSTFFTDRGAVNFMRIDDEVMSYTSIALPAGGANAQVTLTERGLFGTTKAAHDVNATVQPFIMIQGNPLDVMLWLMTSITGDGTNGPYDVLPVGQGCQIDQKYIDIAGIENQRDRFISDIEFQFFIQESTDVKTFIEDEILKVLNAYMVVKNDGRLSIKLCTPPIPTDVVADLTDSDFASIPTFSLAMASNSTFFNETDVSYDYEPISDTFLSERVNVFGDSVENSDEEASIPVSSKGIRGGVFNGPQWIDRYSNMIFTRYGNGCPTINANLFCKDHLIELGDFVTVQSKYIPDPVTRKKDGTPVICEVVNKTPGWGGAVAVTLRGTGYTNTKRWAIIAPAGFPDYDSATDKEKEFCFVSNELSPSVGVMPNGDQGYVVCP